MKLRWVTIAAAATVAAAAAGAAAAEQEPYRPPVLELGEGVGLLDAVRLTLEHDPSIKIEEANTAIQAGVLQELTGDFDLSLVGNLSYQYREQELRESRKELEEERRTELRDAVEEGRMFRDDIEALIAGLEAALDAPPGQETLPDLSTIEDPTIRNTVNVINAQLVLIDALINSSGVDSAARNELTVLRRQILEDNIATANDALQEALDDLAEAERTLEQIGPTPETEVFYTGNVKVELDKLFRNGVFVAPFFDWTYDGTNFKGKQKEAEFGGKDIQDLFTFRVGFNVIVPLARGRGRDSVAAGETAARLEHEASRLLLEHRASVSVLLTTRAYWDLRAAQEAVEVTRRSVELQDQLVELTQALIDAGELPPAEIARVQASRARAQARLDEAERALHEARVNLARTIGLAVDDRETSLPRATDPFPGPPEATLGDEELDELARAAVELRRDLQALLAVEEAGRVLERGARIDTRPRIDVVASTWYTSLGERTVSRALDRWVGPSASLQIDLERPFGNNLLEGQYAQARADTRRRQIDTTDLGRRIRLAIVETAQALAEAAEAVRQARASVEHYQAIYDAEVARFQTGDATLIDTILTEDQQLNARLTLVSAERDLAQLIAQLRFEAGRLVRYERDESAVTQEDLVTLPRPGEVEAR